MSSLTTSMALCGLLATCLDELPAHAETCSVPVGSSAALAEKEAGARLQFISESLHAAGRKERFFLAAWSVAYAGMAAGTWALVPLSSDPGQRIASTWNSATAVAGGLLNILQPLRVILAEKRVTKLAAQSQQGVSCAQLAEAEKLFLRAASSEEGARAPSAHTLAVLTTVGLGLVLTYGLKQPKSAVSSIPIGIAVSELQIWTRPQTAVKRLASYRAGDFAAAAKPEKQTLLIPSVASFEGGYGLALTGTF